MKKITVFIFFLTFGQISFSAIPDSTFFVGGKILNKRFTLTQKFDSSDKKYSFNGTTIALSGGFRGEFIRAFVDYMPESKYKSEELNSNLIISSYSVNVEGFKSFDFFYLAGGVHAENINLVTGSSSDFFAGFVYGLNTALGFFIGRFSGEFIYGTTLIGSEKNNVKYDSVTYQGIGVHYHL